MATRMLRRGSVGPDVAELQAKLNDRDPTSLSALAVDGVFGPDTDARVREFQRLNGLEADGIVGPLTSAALDADNPSPQPTDQDVIHCTHFPGPATGFGLLSSPDLLASLTPVAPPPPASPRAQALIRKPEALKWVDKTTKALGDVLRLMRTGLRADAEKLAGMEETKALNTHFKLDKHSDPLKYVSELLQTYVLIAISIRNSDKLWVDDLLNFKDFANAVIGGYFDQQDAFKGRIRFCPPYLNKGLRFQTGVIIHESAHFVGRQPQIGHYASELPAFDGTPVGTSTKNYAQLSPFEAQRNAYTYAQFSLHMEMGTDHRIVPFNE